MLRVAIIGAGPAGLMAAEQLVPVDGIDVDIFDAMPSVGRKFLMAGKGGMNITHSEPLPAFVARYGSRSPQIASLLDAFGPQALREWIAGLGIATFVGTSGRVFPTEMKAAPLLRAWLHRLRGAGVHFHVRHRWLGWQADGSLRFATPQGEVSVQADAIILALGGGSWARLGSDGAWVPLLVERFAGQPIKPVIASVGQKSQQGEFNITENGVEGGLIYALSAPLRDAIERDGQATLTLDLAPGRSLERLISDLSKPQGRDSLSNHLRRRVGIDGVKAALLREFSPNSALTATDTLARAIKALPVPVLAPRPIDEAISTAGGVVFEALNEQLMLNQLPGTFIAGEMLDWEAPTGGYLLTACFASGYVAGQGAQAWLSQR